MRGKTETMVGSFILVALILFFYLSVQLGTLRFNTHQYTAYTLFFQDASGLLKKADVKIAGVKIGWINTIELNNDARVGVQILIDKSCVLYQDAYGLIRQESILGSKYIELVPGNPTLPPLKSGSVLQPSKEQPSLDALLHEVQYIAHALYEMSGACKSTICDVQVLMQELKNQLPRLTGTTQNTLETLHKTLEPLEEIMCTINDGKGFVGQLLHDQESYRYLKDSAQHVHYYLNRLNSLSLVFDMHGEELLCLHKNNCCRDAKGYFNVRLQPLSDYFCLAGILSVKTGTVSRFEKFCNEWSGCHDNSCTLPQCGVTTTIRKPDSYLFNFQVGKMYDYFALRFGVIESTFGVGIDTDMSFWSDTLRWVSSFEAFDFHGRNRLCDDRPHLKWLNKLFFMNHLYLAFGFDDFVSKYTKRAILGAGIRFEDDDIKNWCNAWIW